MFLKKTPNNYKLHQSNRKLNISKRQKKLNFLKIKQKLNLMFLKKTPNKFRRILIFMKILHKLILI